MKSGPIHLFIGFFLGLCLKLGLLLSESDIIIFSFLLVFKHFLGVLGLSFSIKIFSCISTSLLFLDDCKDTSLSDDLFFSNDIFDICSSSLLLRNFFRFKFKVRFILLSSSLSDE